MTNLYAKYRKVAFSDVEGAVVHLDPSCDRANVATHGYGSDDLPAGYLSEGRWYYLTGRVAGIARGLPLKFVVQKDSVLFFETTDAAARVLGINANEQVVGVNTQATYGFGQCHLFKFKERVRAWCPEGNERLEEVEISEISDGDRLVCVDLYAFRRNVEDNSRLADFIKDHPFTVSRNPDGCGLVVDGFQRASGRFTRDYIAPYELKEWFRRVTVLPEESGDDVRQAFSNDMAELLRQPLDNAIFDAASSAVENLAELKNEVTITFAVPHWDSDGERVDKVIFTDADCWADGGFIHVTPAGENKTYMYPAHKVARVKTERKYVG